MRNEIMVGIVVIIFLLTFGGLLTAIGYGNHLEAMAKIEQGCEELAND